jgi:hypothetical protein
MSNGITALQAMPRVRERALALGVNFHQSRFSGSTSMTNWFAH